MTRLFRVWLNSSPVKFWGFVRRTSWFWVAFLLVLLLPGVREGAFMAFNGPDSFDWQPRSVFHGYPCFVPDEWEGKRPRSVTDFDIQVLRTQVSEYYYSYPGQDNQTFSLSTTRQLLNRFPQEKWLYAMPLRSATAFSAAINQALLSPKQSSSQKSLDIWRSYIVQGEKQEPDNAFYPVCLAIIERKTGHYQSALHALERAGRCSVYDDHNLDFARAWLRAHEHVVTLSIEEKLSFWNSARINADGIVGAEAQNISIENWGRKKSDLQLALRWAGAMARVGHLMQGGPNSPDMWRVGGIWKRRAWSLSTSKKLWSQATAKQWATFASNNGRADLAKEAIQHGKRFDAVKKFETIYQADQGYRMGRARNLVTQDESRLLYYGMIAVFVVMFNGIWMWMVWSTTGILLWRGVGQASSTRERLVPAFLSVITAICAALLICFVLWKMSQLPWALRSGREDVFVMLAAMIFMSLPFWCVPFCAWKAARRGKAVLNIPPRQSMELRLSPFSMFILQRGVQTMVICGVAFTLIIGGAWMLCSWFKWKDVDPILWLAPNFYKSSWNPRVTDLSEGVGAVYGLLLIAFFILAWFVRWRWLVAREKKPVTHRALRHWREITGTIFVIQCWLFLTLLAVLWPTRVSVHHRIEEVAAKGETILLTNLPPQP